MKRIAKIKKNAIVRWWTFEKWFNTYVGPWITNERKLDRLQRHNEVLSHKIDKGSRHTVTIEFDTLEEFNRFKEHIKNF